MRSGSKSKEISQTLNTTFPPPESLKKHINFNNIPTMDYNNVRKDNCFLFQISPRSLTIGKWSHVAAVWDGNLNKAHLFLDSKRLRSENLTSGSYPRDSSHSVYDIGLKRDTGNVLRGHLRDLMVIGRALTGEELLNMEGKANASSCRSFWPFERCLMHTPSGGPILSSSIFPISFPSHLVSMNLPQS